MAITATSPKFPLVYQLFFLWIEPFCTLLGAYFAWFKPVVYLQLTDASSAPGRLLGVPIATSISLRQLGNMYLAFALSEALVLRATSDLKVWRTLLLGLLIADFGHLYTVLPLGIEIYYKAQRWNVIHWGNVGFVYCGALTRLCFLSGLGLGTKQKAKLRARKSIGARPPTNDSASEKSTTPRSTRGRKKA